MPKSSSYPTVTLDDVRSVSPALASLTEEAIVRDLWSRTELSARDRSIVTVSALIAAGRTIGFAHYFNVALDSGVTPVEISEIVTHVAFYAGWSASFSAVVVVKEIFKDRGIGPDDLPPVAPNLLPAGILTDAGNREPLLRQDVDSVVPDFVRLTDKLLYGGVWLRPGLDRRARHLATISALIASRQTEYIGAYIDSATRIGVTKSEIFEVIAHLAFYIGWPSVLSAASIAKVFFEHPAP